MCLRQRLVNVYTPKNIYKCFLKCVRVLLPGYLAYEFDKFWVAEEPESIMQFNQYREKFHNIVKTHLQDPTVCLTLTVNSKN